MPLTNLYRLPPLRGDGTANVADFSQPDSPANATVQLFRAAFLDIVARQEVLRKSEKAREDALKIQSDQSIESVRKRQARQFAAAVEIKNAETDLKFCKKYYEAKKTVYLIDDANMDHLEKYYIDGESELGADISLVEENLQYRAALQGLDPLGFIDKNGEELDRLEDDIAKKERDLLHMKVQFDNKADAQLLEMRGLKARDC